MEQSMRRFMKVGIILHVSYPQLGGGGGPILECLERGLYPSWDAHTEISAALAEKLGYHVSHPYVVYEVEADKGPV